MKKETLVVANFPSTMEEVQFMSIYKTKLFRSRNSETAHKKLHELTQDAHRRGIDCSFRILTTKVA